MILALAAVALALVFRGFLAAYLLAGYIWFRYEYHGWRE